MRLATYLPAGAPQVGRSFDLDGYGRAAAVVDLDGTERLVDLALAAAAHGRDLPTRLLDVITLGPAAIELARTVASAPPEPALVDGEPRLLAPIPAPPSLRDFFAFEAHVATGFAKRNEPIPAPWYEIPVYYKGNQRSIIGPGETIPWPAWTDELDYELELAMVVGVRGRDLDLAAAERAIVGYTLMNDVSARDLQRREMQVRLGPSKSKDFATVLGPVLVTPDEVDLATMRVTARIGDELVTDTDIASMRWSFAEMIEYVSRDEDVFPGDVYGSGTVARGCGLEHGRMVRGGEVVTLTADGIGSLSNPVAAREPGTDEG